MDFKITSENMNSSIESYENIAKKIIENKKRVKSAIDELTDESWNGLRANCSKRHFVYWLEQCNNLENRISDFKEILKEKEVSINNLFDKGKKLKI